MKKIMLFILGVITGAALLFLVAKAYPEVINLAEEEGFPNCEYFEDGEILDVESFQVINVVEDNAAIAINFRDPVGLLTGLAYLLVGEDGTTFYDGQTVEVPKGCVVRMKGTYKYLNTELKDKTIPMVMIMKK